MLSCVNACYLRHLGVSMNECYGYCDGKGLDGCDLFVKDEHFNLCSKEDVRGSDCGIAKKSDCELGCASYSELEDCKGNPDAFNAGFGFCDEYHFDHNNHGYCDQDMVDGLAASEVCAECGKCRRTQGYAHVGKGACWDSENEHPQHAYAVTTWNPEMGVSLEETCFQACRNWGSKAGKQPCTGFDTRNTAGTDDHCVIYYGSEVTQIKPTSGGSMHCYKMTTTGERSFSFLAWDSQCRLEHKFEKNNARDYVAIKQAFPDSETACEEFCYEWDECTAFSFRYSDTNSCVAFKQCILEPATPQLNQGEYLITRSSKPFPGPTSQGCTPYTAEQCRAAAQLSGLDEGGNGFEFEGDYTQKGCYAYSSGEHAGKAFYGLGGSYAEISNPITNRDDTYRPLGWDCSSLKSFPFMAANSICKLGDAAHWTDKSKTRDLLEIDSERECAEFCSDWNECNAYTFVVMKQKGHCVAFSECERVTDIGSISSVEFIVTRLTTPLTQEEEFIQYEFFFFSQCKTSNTPFPGDRADNPIFGGGGFQMVGTAEECKKKCEDPNTIDSHGRPCVAIEHSSQNPSDVANCAFAWDCSEIAHWGGGKVYRKTVIKGSSGNTRRLLQLV